MIDYAEPTLCAQEAFFDLLGPFGHGFDFDDPVDVVAARTCIVSSPCGTYLFVSRSQPGEVGRGGVPTPTNTALWGAVEWLDGQGIMVIRRPDRGGVSPVLRVNLLDACAYAEDLTMMRSRIAAAIAASPEFCAEVLGD